MKPNDKCSCLSGKKYKVCCALKEWHTKNRELYLKNDVPDKYTCLWCCKAYFNTFKNTHNIKILFEQPLGSGYLAKIEMLDRNHELGTKEDGTKDDETMILIDVDEGHFQMAFYESLRCISKFSPIYKKGLCMEECNMPRLDSSSKFECMFFLHMDKFQKLIDEEKAEQSVDDPSILSLSSCAEKFFAVKNILTIRNKATAHTTRYDKIDDAETGDAGLDEARRNEKTMQAVQDMLANTCKKRGDNAFRLVFPELHSYDKDSDSDDSNDVGSTESTESADSTYDTDDIYSIADPNTLELVDRDGLLFDLTSTYFFERLLLRNSYPVPDFLRLTKPDAIYKISPVPDGHITTRMINRLGK